MTNFSMYLSAYFKHQSYIPAADRSARLALIYGHDMDCNCWLIRLACYLLLSLLGLKSCCSEESWVKPAQPSSFWEQMFDYIDNKWTEADTHRMSSQKDQKCLLALFDGQRMCSVCYNSIHLLYKQWIKERELWWCAGIWLKSVKSLRCKVC